MVSFHNGLKNLHGVLGVKSGRRCALPLWFTFQRDRIEDNREKYQEMLSKLRRQKNEEESRKAAQKMHHIEDEIIGQENKEKTNKIVDDESLKLRNQIRSEL